MENVPVDFEEKAFQQAKFFGQCSRLNAEPEMAPI
jgi:hypothetical protein